MTAAIEDTLSAMEPFVQDIARIGRILSHMGTSDFEVNHEEVALVGFLLQDKGRELVEKWEKAWANKRLDA